MTKLMLIVVVLAACYVAQARHMHPRHVIHMEDMLETTEQPIKTDIDGMPIDVIRNIKQSRFVPVNNVIFFTKYAPCEEGFERDLLGICREVWK